MNFNLSRYINIVVVLSVILLCEISLGCINKNNIEKQKEIETTYKQEIEKLHAEKDSHIQELKQEIENRDMTIQVLSEDHREMKEVVLSSRGESDKWEKFRMSFYDLSVASCGKKKNHPLYGVTANGFNLKGLNWEEARTIAVDRNIIPLGSTVKIKFIDDKFSFLDGEYTARDVGGAIKGYKIDLYFGEDAYKECMNLGITEAYVQIIETSY